MRLALNFLATLLIPGSAFSVLLGLVSTPAPQSVIREDATRQAKQRVIEQLDSLRGYVRYQFRPLAQRSQSTDSLQLAFQSLRRLYKRVEPVTAYYMPGTSRLLNGPPLPEIEADENTMFEPGGLQVIEPLLFPSYDKANREELLRQILNFERELHTARYLWYATTPTDAHFFDLMRLGTFRLASLGISGFDTPLCRTAISETAETLRGIQTLLRAYGSGSTAYKALDNHLNRAIVYCRQHPAFESFDRAGFLRAYLNPLAARLLDYQLALGITPLPTRRLLRTTARTLFAPDAFDAAFFAPTADQQPTLARIALGKQLFSDPMLSGNGQRSCATCHQPNRAFTDGLSRATALSVPGAMEPGTLLRNTPTLLNVALQARQFYDLRTRSLEGQAFAVVHNVAEMAGTLTDAARKLQQHRDYIKRFSQAFPNAKGLITADQIQNALASYERSLISLNSRFDRYMRGQTGALTATEVRGFNVFMGKAQCGTCHFLPLFNGTIPPAYTQTESEVIGVPARPDNRQLDTDVGRYAFTKLTPLQYAFKTPTLRHIGQTAPYMHNGVYQTLEEVVDFYDKGGGVGLGFALPNQTLSATKLDLTPSEKKALIAFLNAL